MLGWIELLGVAAIVIAAVRIMTRQGGYDIGRTPVTPEVPRRDGD